MTLPLTLVVLFALTGITAIAFDATQTDAHVVQNIADRSHDFQDAEGNLAVSAGKVIAIDPDGLLPFGVQRQDVGWQITKQVDGSWLVLGWAVKTELEETLWLRFGKWEIVPNSWKQLAGG